jgi:Homodimerisation region of STAR domain protein
METNLLWCGVDDWRSLSSNCYLALSESNSAWQSRNYVRKMSATYKQSNCPVDRRSSEYLGQLLNDKKQLQALPNVFVHVEKLLDEGMFSFV